MQTVEFNNQTYFVNGTKPKDEAYSRFFARRRPTEELDYFLAERKHFSFNSKHVKDFGDLGWILGFFDFNQPSETKVRQAMIWSIDDNCPGDGAYNKYMIKSGGGSASDSCFSSCLSILTADENTGLDKWSVLLKKYSNRFADVLITKEEVSALFELCSNETQRFERDRQYAFDLLKFLLASSLCGKFHYSNSAPVPFTYAKLTGIINKCKPNALDGQWQWAFDRYLSFIAEDRTRVLEEITPGTNRQHQENCTRRERALMELRSFFFPPLAPAETTTTMNARVAQMDLFVAA